MKMKKITLIALSALTLLGCSTQKLSKKAQISPLLIEKPEQLGAVKSIKIKDVVMSLGECIVKYNALSEQMEEVIKYHENY